MQSGIERTADGESELSYRLLQDARVQRMKTLGEQLNLRLGYAPGGEAA